MKMRHQEYENTESMNNLDATRKHSKFRRPRAKKRHLKTLDSLNEQQNSGKQLIVSNDASNCSSQESVKPKNSALTSRKEPIEPAVTSPLGSIEPFVNKLQNAVEPIVQGNDSAKVSAENAGESSKKNGVWPLVNNMDRQDKLKQAAKKHKKTSKKALENVVQLEPEPLVGNNSIEKLCKDQSAARRKDPSHQIQKLLKGVQKYSAYNFLGFVGIHFLSVGLPPMISMFGSKASDMSVAEDSLELARAILHSSKRLEQLIIGSAVIHVVSGVGVRVFRTIKGVQEYGWNAAKIFRMSGVAKTGYYLSPFVSLHFILVRYLPKINNSTSTKLLDMHRAFMKRPWMFIFLNGSLVVFATNHIVEGTAKYLQIKSKRRKTVLYFVSAIWLSSLGAIAYYGQSD